MKAHIHRLELNRPATKAVLLACAVCIAACGTAHSAAPTVTTSKPTNKPADHAIVLTLADSGKKVTLKSGANLTVDLPNQKGSAQRWTLLTSGPGVTETSGGVYGQEHSTPPSQLFNFKWERTTPFGLVLILESPKKKILEPQEFAVTLEPKGYSTKKQ
jgi:hypothetical protein